MVGIQGSSISIGSGEKSSLLTSGILLAQGNKEREIEFMFFEGGSGYVKEEKMKDQRNGESKTGGKKVQGFQVLEEECIWMKAGVVNLRFCSNAYDCYSCPFDKGGQSA